MLISDQLASDIKAYSARIDALREEMHRLSDPIWKQVEPILTQCVEDGDLATLVELEDILLADGFINFEIRRRIKIVANRQLEQLRAIEAALDEMIKAKRDEANV